MANGSVINIAQGCEIGVDIWRKTDTTLQACFLTHGHTDHTRGLSEQWKGRNIHCSQQTKEFVIAKWPLLINQITTVTVGEPFSIHLKDADKNDLDVKVTPIDACHCPVSGAATDKDNQTVGT